MPRQPTKICYSLACAFLGIIGAGGVPVNTFAAPASPQSIAASATLSRGASESVDQIMTRQRQAGPQSTTEALRPGLQPGRALLPEDPGSQNLRATPQPRAGQAGPSAAQTTGTKFLGAQLSDSSFIPPDSMGTVGPSQYVVVVNGRIRSFNKATGSADGVLNATTDTFFNSVRNSSGTSDPRIRFDRLTGRWFITMINVSTPNRVLIAYSNTAVITVSTTFTFSFYDVATKHPGCLWDYDTLGIDVNALYIGGNLFCGAPPGSFTGSNGLVVGKASLLAGSPTITDLTLGGNSCPGGEGIISPQGVDNYDSAATVGYFAGVSLCFFGRLDFVRISNPGGATPTATALTLTVPATSPPLSVPAQGSSHHLDALDDRLFAAQLRNGHLWTAHNICVNSAGTTTSCDRDGSRWYDVTNLDTTPTLNQSGTVFSNAASNPTFYWIPSIMVSGQGHAAMGTSSAGNAEHAEAATMGRLAGDSLGSMQTATVYQSSAFSYNLSGGDANPHRWGDYSYTSLDPSDDMTMWTIQEFTNASNSWGVEVVKLLAPPPATPTTAGGGPFYTEASSQTVNVTGTSTSGSGFFDPGPGFTNRLQAAISGGVTVNSVSYVDPTHINVNFSTIGAAAGPKSLTITNPDGQVVTATNFLNLVNAAPWSASYAVSNTPISWTAGQTQTYTVTITNTGNQTWPSGGSNPVHLGVHFATSGGGYASNSSPWLTDQRFSLPADLAPNASVTLTVSVTAPNTTGNLVLEYQMVKETQFWFNQFADVNVSSAPAWSASYAVSNTPTSWTPGSDPDLHRHRHQHRQSDLAIRR